tara:strand:+ start:9474 stop:10454 length:981 start_codon:yes stop_codon:yes gene_type:complete
MKILITGGYGFFGYHLAKKLSKENYEITIVDIRPYGKLDREFLDLLSQDHIKYLELDLLNKNLDEELDKDFAFIFHLAALLGVRNVLENPLKVLSLNFEMLNNLVSFIDKFNKKPTLIFASTSEIYAGTLLKGKLEFPTPENSHLVLPNLEHPRTSYMLSKIYGEAICHSCDFNSIIIRPHNLYGPRMGMKHVVPQLIKRIYNTPINGELGVYSPSHKRTFCFIDDAVDQVSKLLLINNLKNETFNLGTQSPEIRMRELTAKLIEIMKRNDIIIKEFENTPGSPERRCPLTQKIDNLTLKKDRTSLFDGLKKTYSWYMQYRDQYLS